MKPPLRVRMDITGFVGYAERGPLNFPQPLTSWGEYLDIFGGFRGDGYLPYCVFTFFVNGGEKCYVVRVEHESAAKARLDLDSRLFIFTEQARASLKADGVPEELLNKLEAEKERVFKGTAQFMAVLVKAIGAGQTEKFRSPFLKQARRRLIHVEPINLGAWGNDIEVVAEGDSSDDLFLTELTGDLDIGDTEAHFKSLAGLQDEISGEVKGDQIKLLHPSIPTQQEQVSIKELRFDQGKAVFDKPVSKKFPAGTRVLGKGFRLTFRYTRNGQLVRGELFDNLSADPNHERYFVRVINGDPEEPDYIKRLRAGSSILARVTDLCEGDARPRPRISGQATNLSGGRDGERAQVETNYFTGYKDGGYFRPTPTPGARSDGGQQNEFFGLAAYEAVEEIGLVAIPDLILPDLYDALLKSRIPEQGIIFAEAPKPQKKFERLKDAQAEMLFHCQKMGERFAILDSPRRAEIGRGENKIEEWPSNFQLLPAARYGALYYPWVRQKNVDFDGRELFIPPCGAVAGIYSRSEQKRGVGKAPANEVLQGAVELEFCLDDAEQAILNPKGINCLRIFPGRGLRVWGARTFSLEPLSIYVNVRRMVLSVIKNILVNLRWTVFEPNDRQLWNTITATLSLFFNGLFESGALAGASPKEAFFVKCDEETNPPEIVDLGQVITEIGFAPERPAEFILVTIKRSPGALSVIER
ncbi:MAG TPA: phage tail sheath subtilisin-like domain-containing protein [Pyrinomonadaceae bacterium]|nr:phage tail sheath subtilisin-like domain-containing protein [Pyrinomonadaceae bacterium]